jgi:hypothetical protein
VPRSGSLRFEVEVGHSDEENWDEADDGLRGSCVGDGSEARGKVAARE